MGKIDKTCPHIFICRTSLPSARGGSGALSSLLPSLPFQLVCYLSSAATMFRLGLIVKSIVSVSSPLSAHSFTYWSQYLRITLNYVTLSFFLFSFLHCFAQGILQSFLYTADDTWGSLTSQIVSRGHPNSTVFPQFTGRHGSYSLELCDAVPGDPNPCVHFFTAGQPNPITIPQRFLPSSAQAPELDASFVRQPFFFFSFIEPIWGSLKTLPASRMW